MTRARPFVQTPRARNPHGLTAAEEQISAPAPEGQAGAAGNAFAMEKSGRERRLKPRYGADLACGLTLAEAERDILFPGERLECRTRDLSETGVGLVAGTIYLGYTCVVDEGRALLLTLELPARTIEMETTPAHYLRLDADAGEPAYLIGLRITSMSEADGAAYHRYLEELSRSEQD